MSEKQNFLVHYHGGKPASSRGLSVPREVERIHLANGWSGVGYNFLVDLDGVIYEGRGWDGVGAQCPGYNRNGIGVYVAIGGDQEPTPEALASVRWLYDEACRRAGHDLRKMGHRDGVKTACPGEHLYAWVKAGMPVPADSKPAPSKPSKPASKPSKPAPLAVDGKMGPATIRRWQEIMGTTPDGKISQPSALVRAVQRRLRKVDARLAIDGLGIRSNNDGKVGPTHTIRALQRYLGTTPDGVLSHPTSEAVRALQRRLNTGKF
jgi:hypothetical protein